MSAIKVLTLLCILGGSVLFAEPVKVVYDLTSGDSVKIKKHLIHSVNEVARYYKSQNKEFKAIVVISGKAYQFFIEDLKDSPYAGDTDLEEMQPELKPLLMRLHKEHHVVFDMCQTGMHGRNIKEETLYKFVNAQKMKSVYLIDAQNDGYAYMPIH